MTKGHVLVVASGFGKRVIAKAPPFELAIEGDARLVVRMGARSATVEPAQSLTTAGVRSCARIHGEPQRCDAGSPA